MRVLPALRYCTLGLTALACVLLAGCSAVSKGSVETLRLAFHRSKVAPTAESVSALPYFQMQVNAPTGQAILVLAKVEDGRLGWYGGQHDIVFTRNGVLVKTVGLPQNLDSQSLGQGEPFDNGLQNVRGPVDYTRRMDWSPGYRYGIDLRGHIEPRGEETVTILGQPHQLLRYDEQLTVVSTGQRMDNRYWVDPSDGFIWRSQQHVAPGFSLELIQLRPYRGAKL